MMAMFIFCMAVNILNYNKKSQCAIYLSNHLVKSCCLYPECRCISYYLPVLN